MPIIIVYYLKKKLVMKNKLLIILCSVSFFIFSSCSSKVDVSIDLEAIAESEEYSNYVDATDNSIAFVRSKSIDYSAIEKSANIGGNWILCDLNDEALKGIENGIEYRDLDCAVESTKMALLDKFPEIYSLSKEQLLQLRELNNKIN